MEVDNTNDLEFGARIYYRHILDRYSLIPPYLARRRATANFHRAESLRCQRFQAEQEKNMALNQGMGACENTSETDKNSCRLFSAS